MGFDLASVLKNVPESGTNDGRERIEYIGLDKLHDDPNNFYSLDGIEELAENIEFAGLQQPVRVRRDAEHSGEYIIVSGHRRTAAMRKIVEDGNKAFEAVPCIVEAEGGSEALRELRLIYANSDTRRMSSADISKQAERVEALLYQLKEEGVEFPGRMRDHVAEACKVSKSKLSRLKVIRDKLAPDIYAGYYERGKLPEDTAYELAKLSVDTQRVIVDRATQKDRVDIKFLHSSKVKSQGEDIQRFSKMVCRCEQGGTCVNVPNMMDKLYSNGWRGYTHCGSGCCYDCDELATCSTCCSRMAGVKAQKKAEKKEAKAKAEEEAAEREAAEAAAQAERDRPMIDSLRLLWNRMGEACKRAGVNYEEICHKAGLCTVLSRTPTDMRLNGEGPIKADDWPPFGSAVSIYNARSMVKLADLLGCSLDYLFGRDVPESGTGTAEPKWQTGEPPEDGNYLVRYRAADDETESPDFSDVRTFCGGVWSLPADAVVTAWYRVPRGR